MATPTESRAPAGSREGHDTGAAVPDPPAAPTGETDGGELLFQRCRWCGTPGYRRSSCRACGSTVFRCERSAGRGVVLRRSGQTQRHTWFVAMAEGFNLLCRIEAAEPVVVAVGARVSVVRPVDPGPGLPVAELTRPELPGERWW